ncbi:hypothetical protein F8S13_14115 [Chloroflexia bacterium SDU3-3]|nr:hypothetical protein F8S13_14115 [Chloroflexia bacterium SDU3-3]
MGRDTYFTYGPLSQLIMSLGVLLRGNSSVINGFSTGYLMFEITGVFLFSLAIMLVSQIRWHWAALIFCVGFLLDGVLNMRQAMVLFSMALLIRALDAPPSRRRWQSALAGISCFIAQLMTSEIGVYTIVAACGLLGVLSVLAALPRARILQHLHHWQVYASSLAMCLGSFLTLNGILEVVFQISSPAYRAFDYVRYTGAIMTGYNYTMSTPWSLGEKASLMLLVLIVFCALAAMWMLWRAPRAHAHLILGLGVAAALNLKSTLVRSDTGHIIMACSPLIFFFLVLICLSSWRSPLRYMGLAMLAVVLLYWPNVQVSTVQQIGQILNGDLSLRTKWREVHEPAVQPEWIAPEPLQQALGPGTQVVSFPYDNVIAMASGRRSLAPILQTYSAHTELLQDHYVDVIQRQQESVEIIYGMDGRSVGGVDGVQNISRVPRIFRYILEHFELKTPEIYRSGYIVLHPRTQPKALGARPITFQTQMTPQGQTFTLAAPATCRVLDLELEMHYPITAAIGKPRELVATVYDGDAKVVQGNLVAIERTRPFHTYLYLGQPKAFWELFSPTTGPESESTFTTITLNQPPASIFDVQAQGVVVHSLSCVGI